MKFWTHHVTYQTRVTVATKEGFANTFAQAVNKQFVNFKVKFRHGIYDVSTDPSLDRYLEFFDFDRSKAESAINELLLSHKSGPNGRRDFIVLDESMKFKSKVEMDETARKQEEERQALLTEAKRFGVGAERIKMSNPELRRAVEKEKDKLKEEIKAEPVESVPEVENKLKPVRTVTNKVKPRVTRKRKTTK